MDNGDIVRDAQVALYAAPPEKFITLRAELEKHAKSAADPAAARTISAFRKPTASASVVNRLVLSDTSALDRCRDLHQRLSSAHLELDAVRLRELSTERRSLVSGLADAAFRLAGVAKPSIAQRDEVVGTFDAAISDPDVASRLGRLIRAERFSGFGPVLPGSPDLTLLSGGKSRSHGDRSRQSSPGRETAAARRGLTRALHMSRAAFEAASQRLSDAEAIEQTEARRVTSLAAEVADKQRELDDAKISLDAARTEVRSARTDRRVNRSALDRAERATDT